MYVDEREHERRDHSRTVLARGAVEHRGQVLAGCQVCDDLRQGLGALVEALGVVTPEVTFGERGRQYLHRGVAVAERRMQPTDAGVFQRPAAGALELDARSEVDDGPHAELDQALDVGGFEMVERVAPEHHAGAGDGAVTGGEAAEIAEVVRAVEVDEPGFVRGHARHRTPSEQRRGPACVGDSDVAPAISISGLVKTFGATRALDGLDLVVESGEVHGFLGPNGSGKTTTIRVLLGLLRADAGTIELLGADPWHQAVELHRHLAYVPGEVSLWPKLSGGEVIDLLGRLRGDLDPKRRDELLERFELDPTKKARTYSKGNRQKVGLVAALSSEAELLMLDEPTSGLDPLMEAVFQDCIREIKAEGRTVLLSSHILAEVEALCDRVSIIRAGRTQQSGTLSELRRMTRTSITAETVAARRRVAGRRRCPWPRDRRRPRALPCRHRAARCGHAAIERTRASEPGEPSADARGVVPPPLRR